MTLQPPSRALYGVTMKSRSIPTTALNQPNPNENPTTHRVDESVVFCFFVVSSSLCTSRRDALGFRGGRVRKRGGRRRRSGRRAKIPEIVAWCRRCGCWCKISKGSEVVSRRRWGGGGRTEEITTAPWRSGGGRNLWRRDVTTTSSKKIIQARASRIGALMNHWGWRGRRGHLHSSARLRWKPGNHSAGA